MHIVICGSLSFVREMDVMKETLQTHGHEVVVPLGADLVRDRKVLFEQFEVLKELGQSYKLTEQYDAIRVHYHKIVDSEAVLVANWGKKGIEGYIGGNTFLEMGFAHVHHKNIYVLHNLPDLPYADEMRAMQPIILHGDVTRIPNAVSVEKKEPILAS